MNIRMSHAKALHKNIEMWQDSTLDMLLDELAYDVETKPILHQAQVEAAREHAMVYVALGALRSRLSVAIKNGGKESQYDSRIRMVNV